MPQTTIFDSVVAVTDEPDETSARLLGTAFYVGQGVFATAGHVVEAVRGSSRASIRRLLSDGGTEPHAIQQSEHWGNVDFGLLKTDFMLQQHLSWLQPRLAEPTDVATVGFAFGLDISRRKLSIRHFRGYIVSCQRYSSWGELEPAYAGRPEYPFWTYELSFACPVGQSGSPLLVALSDGVSIAGVVVGNSTSSLDLLRRLEQSDDGRRVERYEVHEFLHLGQAIASPTLLDGTSILLGNLGSDVVLEDRRRSLREHLAAGMVRTVKEN